MITNTGQQQDSTLELVLFKAGQYRFGVESASVRSSGELPGHHIASIESLLALSCSSGYSRRHCLTIKGNSQDYEISVAAPLELCSIPVEIIHPLPAVLSARCKLPGLRALAVCDNGLTLLVELNRLLASAEKNSLL
jgi:hypothetical protein